MLCLERCLTKPTSLDGISKKRGFGRKVITAAKVWRCAPLPSTDLHFINDSHEWAESTWPYDIYQQRVVHPLAPWLPLLKLPFVDNNASPCVCARVPEMMKLCQCRLWVVWMNLQTLSLAARDKSDMCHRKRSVVWHAFWSWRCVISWKNWLVWNIFCQYWVFSHSELHWTDHCRI